MAKKNNHNNNNDSGITKTQVAFWVIVIGGFAFILAYLLGVISSDLAGAAHWIANICCLIAWIIVMMFGWRIAGRRAMIWKVVYLVCCLAILVFCGLIFFRIGFKV